MVQKGLENAAPTSQTAALFNRDDCQPKQLVTPTILMTTF